MPITTTFDKVMFSSDGGQEVVEIVTTIGEIVGLYDMGLLEVRNARPMHQKKLLANGTEKEFTGTDVRLKRWVDQLIRNEGILGNLSWAFDPDTTEVELDYDAGTLTLHKGKIETPDSATRHRAIIDASRAPVTLLDPNRKVSVRGWFVPKQRVGEQQSGLTFEQVFDSYNQDGKPVNATVAKFNYQRDAVSKLVRALVEKSPHLGLDNVEVVQNAVSSSSSKLAAYNTFATAFADLYKADLDIAEEFDAELAWLLSAWDELVQALPGVGRVGKSKAQAIRETSVMRSAVVVYGYVGLLARIREEGADPGASLAKLPGQVALTADSAETRLTGGQLVPVYRQGEVVDFFSTGNPLWQRTGLLVPVENPDTGAVRLQTRNARQTRMSVLNALVERAGI